MLLRCFKHIRSDGPTEMKVAGKKVIVIMAIAFIAVVSFFASSPILTWICLSRCAAVWKAYSLVSPRSPWVYECIRSPESLWMG